MAKKKKKRNISKTNICVVVGIIFLWTILLVVSYLRWGIVGIILDNLLRYLFGIYYLAANCISVLAGITTSFLLNRNINFKVKDHYKRRFVVFLCVGLCGLVLSNVILYLGIDKMHCDETIVKLASIVLVVGFQFLLNKFVTFKYNFDK